MHSLVGIVLVNFLCILSSNYFLIHFHRIEAHIYYDHRRWLLYPLYCNKMQLTMHWYWIIEWNKQKYHWPTTMKEKFPFLDTCSMLIRMSHCHTFTFIVLWTLSYGTLLHGICLSFHFPLGAYKDFYKFHVKTNNYSLERLFLFISIE